MYTDADLAGIWKAGRTKLNMQVGFQEWPHCTSMTIGFPHWSFNLISCLFSQVTQKRSILNDRYRGPSWFFISCWTIPPFVKLKFNDSQFELSWTTYCPAVSCGQVVTVKCWSCITDKHQHVLQCTHHVTNICACFDRFSICRYGHLERGIRESERETGICTLTKHTYHHVYLYLSLSIYIYLFLSISISIYLYLSLSISIYLYLSLSISIYHIYIYIYLYLSKSIYIYLYLSIFISIYIYLYLSISIYIYLYLSISISIYLYLCVYLTIYLYLSIYL